MVIEEVKEILQGKPVTLRGHVDIHSDEESSNFTPRTKVNMCYICMTVLLNEQGHILLIQEAKKSCRGQWYLPAGRLEPGETIPAGAKREVKEEAGVDCDLISLIGVEINNQTWIRLTFVGKITGGSLKTVEQADAESLQARFFSMDEIHALGASLRHRDIIRFIDLARTHQETDVSDRFPVTLPVIAPHRQLIHRLVIIDRCHLQVMNILAHKKKGLHLPTALINHNQGPSIAISVYAILREAFSSSISPSVRMCGILGLEHRGTSKMEDGICLTSLVSLDLSEGVDPPAISGAQYQWCAVSSANLRQHLSNGAKGKIVPLF